MRSPRTKIHLGPSQLPACFLQGCASSFYYLVAVEQIHNTLLIGCFKMFLAEVCEVNFRESLIEQHPREDLRGLRT